MLVEMVKVLGWGGECMKGLQYEKKEECIVDVELHQEALEAVEADEGVAICCQGVV